VVKTTAKVALAVLYLMSTPSILGLAETRQLTPAIMT
jgi:hypothetical protein